MIKIALVFLFCFEFAYAQESGNAYSYYMRDSVRVTIDPPASYQKHKPVIVTFYCLPNGNTTEQTMGKKMQPGDDWHFDIQHIKAQTRFIRQQWTSVNFVVVYLENNLKAWPAWKQRHPDFRETIPAMVDSIVSILPGKKKEIYLNGHSGGGSFIFGYLAGVEKIPSCIKRISFLDSNYGYDSSYYSKFRDWLRDVKGSALNVFAYNDSIALLNGKPFVSATGGTWYRSHVFIKHLSADFAITKTDHDSLIYYTTAKGKARFFIKTNPERKIYHTTQVERNGFIHTIFCGTPRDSRHYTYYGERAYNDLIE